MSDLVSIIIPCRNGGRFLDETLRSALAQSWTAIEIIVVDDHSSDDSREVAARYSARNVRLLDAAGTGASAARNRGLAEARGDFIQYLDADDLLSPDKIESQVALLQASPTGCVAFSATCHFPDGGNSEDGVWHSGWPMIDSDDPVGWLVELFGPDHEGSMVHPCAWLTPRAVAEKAGPWNEQLTLDDDGEYFCRVVLASRGLRRSRQGHSLYRKFPASTNNLSAQSSAAHLRSALLSLDLRAKHLLARASGERAKQALAHCYKQHAYRAYPMSIETVEAALRRARELGYHTDPATEFATWKGRALARILGWKAVRRINIYFHQHMRSLKA